MAITLNRYAVGDTNYVAKLNTNAAVVEAAFNNLERQLAVVQGGKAPGLDDIWKNSGLIGTSSYIVTLISDTDLSFTSGSVWHLNPQIRARQTTNQTITFVGKATGTYFVNVDIAGIVTISTAAAPIAIYSVLWSNPNLTNITRLVPYLLDGTDYSAMLSSTTLGVFTKVADRLSAMEDLAGANTSYVDGFAKSGVTENLSGNIGVNDFTLDINSFSGTVTRGLVYYLEISTTMDPNEFYDIEVYGSNLDSPPEVSQLEFEALAIPTNDNPYVTRLPFMYTNIPEDGEVFLRISNNGTSAALFTWQWRAEKFA
jgi:hypothetical protein